MKGFYARFGKRAFDLAVALVALVVLSPVFLVLVIAIRMRLGSPVLFRQRRTGWRRRAFDIVKFRSMLDEVDADGRPLPDAERLTPFGRCASARFMSAIGTCPSKVMPSMIAVWQEARSAGTPRAFINAGRFASSTTCTARPNCAFTIFAHSPQQPHPGSRCTRIASAATATEGTPSTKAANR